MVGEFELLSMANHLGVLLTYMSPNELRQVHQNDYFMAADICNDVNETLDI